MWLKLVGTHSTDTKLHYVAGERSLCGKIKIDSTDYVRYETNPKPESKCKGCLEQITIPPVY